jgi:hypothetical protein
VHPQRHGLDEPPVVAAHGAAPLGHEAAGAAAPRGHRDVLVHAREALDAQAQPAHDPHAVVGHAGVEEVGEGRVLQPAGDRVQAARAPTARRRPARPRAIGEDAALGRRCDQLAELHDASDL